MCGLSYASHKSELLMLHPGRPQKESPSNVTITIDSATIKSAQQIRILVCGCKAMDGRMRPDIAVTEAFVVSRVTYSAPYLLPTKANRETLNTVLLKATKQAMGVPIYSLAQKLLHIGTHNTVEELMEVLLSN
ncbi:hypothetical protein HPB50_008368 [Hyalomma asiaticum]|uniref:Uncharacterized protein n=1 Tax=Hyalomma asiaticum TaxID=266040 RepID=A0ACB7RRU2_HYAAI|nr:hypothetical protein HPB50_008368 [Hyalomma asiaticum]